MLQHLIPQERVRKFYDTIVKTQKLNSADALKLKGRVQFTAGELFGRVVKTCLTRVTSHAYRSGSTDVSDSLASFLLLFNTFLLAQKPRLVSLSLSQTWTVFADASYKQEIEGDQSLPLVSVRETQQFLLFGAFRKRS